MWYVIWTLTGKENMLIGRIQSELPDKLYRRCYTPVRMERQKHNGELVDVERILFPGYIFIDTDTPEDVELELESLHGQTGLIGFLKNESVYLAVSPEECEIIGRLIGEEGVAGVSVGIIENGILRVIDGPLKGFEQYITKVDRHRRKAYVAMPLFGEVRHFNLGLQVVEKDNKI